MNKPNMLHKENNILQQDAAQATVTPAAAAPPPPPPQSSFTTRLMQFYAKSLYIVVPLLIALSIWVDYNYTSHYEHGSLWDKLNYMTNAAFAGITIAILYPIVVLYGYMA